MQLSVFVCNDDIFTDTLQPSPDRNGILFCSAEVWKGKNKKDTVDSGK